MPQIIKLISLNIEGDKHFDTVIPFLQKENADSVCLQEVFEKDALLFQEKLGYSTFLYGPLCTKKGKSWGVCIFSKNPLRLLQKTYYAGSEEHVKEYDTDNKFGSVQRLLLTAELTCNNTSYIIGTTHFTWTPNGQTNDEQRVDMPNLLKALAIHEEIVLCGDFNAPRGGDMWTTLAQHYKDNIPTHITNTLDPQFHRAPSLVRLVDGLFSTQSYRVSNVRVKNGISDHCAIIGNVGMQSKYM